MFPRHDMRMVGTWRRPPVPHCVQCSPKKPNYDPVDAVWPVWPVSRDPTRVKALVLVSSGWSRLVPGIARLCSGSRPEVRIWAAGGQAGQDRPGSGHKQIWSTARTLEICGNREIYKDKRPPFFII